MTNPFDKPAYLEKFGLKEPPYTTNPDERYLYLTETHEEAIHMCGRLISNREGAGLIVGEQGTGKTTIMRRLYSLMQSHGQFQVSIIETAEHCPSLFQLSKKILESFGQTCVSRDTKSRLDQLKAFLLRSFAEQQTCVLMIDEAQQMKGPVLESLRGRLNFEDPTAVSREAFHLIEKLWLRKYESDAEARAAETTQGYIIWGKELWESLHAGYIKNLDLDFYYRLPSALTRRLYRFLDKRMHHQDQMEIDIFELTGRLGQAAYTKPSEAYRKLKPAIEQLIQARFLASAAAVKRGKYTRVRFSKASPKALRQQKKQQQNQDQQMEQLAMLQTQYHTAGREKAAEQFLRTHLKVQLDEFAFNFFARCHLLALHEQTVVLCCPNVVILDWIKKNLNVQIEQALAVHLNGGPVKLEFVNLKAASGSDQL